MAGLPQQPQNGLPDFLTRPQPNTGQPIAPPGGQAQLPGQDPNQQADPNQSINPNDQQPTQIPEEFQVDEEKLLRALVSRGKSKKWEINIGVAEHDAIVYHVMRDFEDANYANGPYKRNMNEMYANWRGVSEPKDFPFDGCANFVVPLTSVLIETMKARIIKAIFGGDYLAKLSYVDKQVPNQELDEMNDWFRWELNEIVKIQKWANNWVHNFLLYGIDITIPWYKNETRYLHSFKRWELDDSKPLTELLYDASQEIINEPSTWGDEAPLSITDSPALGEYNLDDGGKISFSFDTEEMKLRADIFRRETVFNGVKLNQVQLEDLVVANTAPDIEDIPFFGARQFYTAAQYRQGIEDGFFIDYGEKENQRIIETFDYTKISELIDQEQTNLADRETGTDSRDTSASNATHRYCEVYRWEGWWVWDPSGETYSVDKLLQPATQIAVWVAVRAKKILKIERLEDLNKDGKRSGVKTGFIEEPGRFYPMGLAEWVRHSQTELDAVHNQRVDAGYLYNIPFGFYKPSAGLTKDAQPLKMEPGKFFPVADPMGVNCPRTNWQPTVSFAEENLIVRYANLQAGLTDPALGQPVSKRQSASEYVGNANAIDTRSEDLIRGIVDSLREIVRRILGLYEQFGPRIRIFRTGGEAGAKLTKQFERDRLHGKLTIDMMASLMQLNEQLQKQTALDMLQLLLNNLLIQSGITDPITIYEAIREVARLSHYENVTIHRPNIPPISDPPDVEERQLYAGQKPTGPTPNENTAEHMMHHSMTMADSQLMAKWPQSARDALADHVQQTLKLQQAQQIIQQQRAIQATQMQMSMAQKGIRPGQAGSQNAGENTGPGTAGEGVRNQGQGGVATPPTPAQR
jgi:hypothetical protein